MDTILGIVIAPFVFAFVFVRVLWRRVRFFFGFRVPEYDHIRARWTPATHWLYAETVAARRGITAGLLTVADVLIVLHRFT